MKGKAALGLRGFKAEPNYNVELVRVFPPLINGRLEREKL